MYGSNIRKLGYVRTQAKKHQILFFHVRKTPPKAEPEGFIA